MMVEDRRFFTPVRRLFPLAFGCVCIAAMLVGCGGPTTTKESSSADHSQSGSELYGDYDNIPGQVISAKDQGVLEGAPKLRECVEVKGSSPTAELLVHPCDSERAVLRVYQLVAWPATCTPDADQKYFRGLRDGKRGWTACLDVNWQPNRCVEITQDHATPCSRDANDRQWTLQRVVSRKASSTLCSNAEGAKLHPDRNFTVCTLRVHRK